MSREDLEVPAGVRAEVLDRDASCCRVCGRFVQHPALHHLVFRSQGGLHVPENLVTVGWLWDHDCHLRVMHGKSADGWRKVMQEVIKHDGMTGLLLVRRLKHQEAS